MPPARATAGRCQLKSSAPATPNAITAPTAAEVVASRRRTTAATDATQAPSSTSPTNPASTPSCR